MGGDRRCRATDEFPASDRRLGGGAVSDHPGRHRRRRSLPATISSVTITPDSMRPTMIAPIQPRPTSRSTAIATARMTRYRRVRGPRWQWSRGHRRSSNPGSRANRPRRRDSPRVAPAPPAPPAGVCLPPSARRILAGDSHT